MSGQKLAKSLATIGSRLDVAVEAALPLAALGHPTGPGRRSGQFAAGVQRAYQRSPKSSPRIGRNRLRGWAVFASREGGLAGHAAEDQRMGIGAQGKAYRNRR